MVFMRLSVVPSVMVAVDDDNTMGSGYTISQAISTRALLAVFMYAVLTTGSPVEPVSMMSICWFPTPAGAVYDMP